MITAERIHSSRWDPPPSWSVWLANEGIDCWKCSIMRTKAPGDWLRHSCDCIFIVFLISCMSCLCGCIFLFCQHSQLDGYPHPRIATPCCVRIPIYWIPENCQQDFNFQEMLDVWSKRTLRVFSTKTKSKETGREDEGGEKGLNNWP